MIRKVILLFTITILVITNVFSQTTTNLSGSQKCKSSDGTYSCGLYSVEI